MTEYNFIDPDRPRKIQRNTEMKQDEENKQENNNGVNDTVDTDKVGSINSSIEKEAAPVGRPSHESRRSRTKRLKKALLEILR